MEVVSSALLFSDRQLLIIFVLGNDWNGRLCDMQK